MTIKGLISMLQKEDPSRIVILSIDSEGNSFSPMGGDFTTGAYRGNGATGDFGLEPGELTPALKRKGYSEDDVIGNGKKAILFWPLS